MKKFLSDTLCILVVLAATSFADAAQQNFAMSESPEEDCSVPGTCYYVDNAVNSSGDGSSWNNAWKSFANIDWSQINPGNIIYISGGTTSKTYKENMVVRASGTLGNQIKITNGVDPGHNGQAVIDGSSFGSATGIHILHPSEGGACVGYVTISHLSFINWGNGTGDREAIGIRGEQISGYTVHNQSTAVTGVIVEHNKILCGERGITFRNSYNCIARENDITTPASVNIQTDGIYSQVNRSNIYENNFIIITNSNATQHLDCIQTHLDGDITIRGNYLEQDNAKVSNAQGIMIGEMTGTTTIEDNTIYLKSASSPINAIARAGYGGIIQIFGNTICSTGGSGYGCSLRNFNNPVIVDNIIALTTNTGTPLAIYATTGVTITWKPDNIHNNLLWRSDSARVASVTTAAGTTAYDHDPFQAAGANEPGGNFNPVFNDIANRDFKTTDYRTHTMSTTGSCVGAVPCEP